MTDSSVHVWILLIFLLLNLVYCQERISVFVGEDILLPCSYKPSSKINVYWRYRETQNLINILDGTKIDLSRQNPRFRNRTLSFPHLYAEGNFSVVLMDVNLNDAGPYDCEIPKAANYQRQLELTVKEQTSTAEPEAASPPGGDSVSVREHSHSTLIFIMMSLILLNTS